MSSLSFSSQLPPGKSKRGFALIITIVLVAFLVLLVVSLATFTRVETVVSDNADSKLAARQNALAALNIALGELQRAAGPDQRVTAPAESTPSPSVLAAALPTAPSATYNRASWNTFDTNLDTFWDGRSPNWVGVWRNGAAFPTTSPRLVNWLVSGNEHESVVTGAAHSTPTFSPDMAVNGLTTFSRSALLNPTINGRPGAVLVGNYSVSAQADPASPNNAAPSRDLTRYVVAPKVDINGVLPDGTNGVVGRYAWWVGDQGTKATLDAAHFNINDIGDSNNDGTTDLSAAVQQILKLQQPTRVGFEASLNNFISTTDWARVVSYGQVAFGPTNIDARDVRSQFHDFGLVSTGLLTDLRNGGFRADLTANPAATPVGSGLNNYISAADTAGTIVLGDLLVGNAGGNTSPNPQSHPDRDARSASLIRTYPFRNIVMGTYEPVVAAVRVSYNMEYNAGFVLTPRPELMIWNPYNADFEWVQAIGGDVYRNGYRYRVRISYDEDDNSGRAWDGQFSVSAFWLDAEGVLAPQTTVDTFPLDLFVDGVDTDLTPNPNREIAEFLSDPHTGLGAASVAGRNWRLRSGDVALLRGSPMQRDGSSSLGGISENAVALPDAVAAAAGANPNYYETFDNATVLSFAVDPATPRNIRIEVYARAIDHAGADVNNPDPLAFFLSDGPSKDNVKERSIFNETLALELANFDPSANNSYVTLASWRAAWRPATPPDGFFNPSVELISYNTSTHQLDPDGEGVLALGFNSSVLDANFWTDYMENNDPRRTFRSVVRISDSNDDLDTDASLGRRFGDLSIGLPALGADDDRRFPVLYEVPRVAPASLGELMHIFPSATGQSPHLLGLDPNTVPGGIAPTVRNLNNDAWDSFFFSGLNAPLSLADVSTFKPTNTRLKIQGVPNKTDNDTRNYLNGVAGRPEAAALKLVGAFNVNSPSPDSWESVLNNSAANNLAAVGWDTAAGGDDGFVIAGLGVNTSYGRFAHAPGATWSFRHTELDAESPDGQASLVRNGHRALAPLDFHGRLIFNGGYGVGVPPGGPANPVTGISGRTVLEEFSRILTLDMKRRVRDAGVNGGPFLSLADFVNSGTLQYAIDNVEWTNGPTTESGLNWVQHTRNNWENFSTYKNLPSHLSQREMLKALAPVLAARSDTFIIRTYGEVINPTDPNDVVGRAWCEALVQRYVDYVDSSDDPEDTVGLDPINVELGRRFRIIAFRWLDATDI